MIKPCEVFKSTLKSKPNVRIKLLGDSITHGVGGTGYEQSGFSFIKGFARNPDGYCWANKFQKLMEEKHHCSVVNNACSGTNIQYVIENFDTLVDDEDDLIICTIGTNNRHVYFKTGYKPSREELGTTFYENVLKLGGMFRERGKNVILIANIPASEKNEQDGETFWRILHMEDINYIYKKANEKLDLPFFSMFDLFSAYCNTNRVSVDSLLGDGLHPNDRGYDVMFDLICKELELLS